jgi:beta-glucosidase/6-phospho-beta-glucosidase/beta-galactosidase
LRAKGCGFNSFFLGGFECSTHRLRSGKRLDLIDSTGHDRFADADYRRLKSVGIETARDGVRWHLVETSPRRYNFSSVLPLLRAARRNGVQVIWDLCHYGWPDDIDLFSVQFVRRFTAFAREFARVVVAETDGVPYFAPVNEISFFSWAAGEVGYLNPFNFGRGDELKAQLVRANISAIDAIRGVCSEARIVQVDPLVNVIAEPTMSFHEIERAEAHSRAIYDSWDMVVGRKCPETGGREDYLDILGANYYVHNQWIYNGCFVERSHPQYRPLHDLLAEWYQRYERPVFIAETGIEDDRRPEWLSYVCDEVIAALQAGVPIEGICLYPIVNHAGWDDERHCHNGLWDYCNDCGEREVYTPLAHELARQRARIGQVLADLELDRTSLGVYV